MLLLVADSTDECAVYEPLTTSFDYSTDCARGGADSGTGGASSGFGAAGNVAGSAGVGGSSGAGTSGTSGSSGAAGSAAALMGHVLMKIPSNQDDADFAATQALQAAGLNASHAEVVYRTDGECGGGQDGVATVRGLNVTFQKGNTHIRCSRLALPVRDEQTVTCTELVDAAEPATCSLTFSPTPR